MLTARTPMTALTIASNFLASASSASEVGSSQKKSKLSGQPEGLRQKTTKQQGSALQGAPETVIREDVVLDGYGIE